MRSIFSAGLLDGFINNKFNPFDLYIGVSAGAYNLSAFMAGTTGRSLHVYKDYALHKNFISYSRFIRGGHLVDLDWLFDTTLSQSHLDFNAIYRDGKPLYVCVTDVHSGKPVYINTTSNNLKDVIKASAALPLLYRKFPVIDGRPMTDGGVADGLPVAEAIRFGATRIMVIRSRATTYEKRDTLGHKLIRWKLRKYPLLTAAMQQRVDKYKNVINLIRHPPRGINILEICPQENFNAGRFSRSRKHLLQGYHSGLNLAQETIQKWMSL